MCVRTYYVQHEVVTQTRRAVNPDQDAIFQGGAEANGQPVRPGAWSLVGWPLEGNEASSFAKDVRRPSWTEEGGGGSINKNLNSKVQQGPHPDSKAIYLSIYLSGNT